MTGVTTHCAYGQNSGLEVPEAHRASAQHAMCQTRQVRNSTAQRSCRSDQQDIPASGLCAADLLVTDSSAIVGWVAGWEEPGAVVEAAPAGAESCVERAEAGGALVLTGSSDVVRPLPAAPYY